MLTPQDMGNQLALEVVKEGIKFLFGVAKSTLEAIRTKGKKIDSAKENIDNSKTESAISNVVVNSPTDLLSKLDFKAATIEEANIKSLLEQIEIHNRNINHYETQKATFGLFVPPYIESGILKEKDSLIEKSKHLRSILERVYKTRFDLPQFD